MERWMKLSGNVPSLSLIPLGTYHNGKYYMDDECLNHLEEINIKLKGEDATTRPIRCTVAFLDVLNKDLIPILINSKDQPAILNSTIKLLAELTTPLECLNMQNGTTTATQQVVIYKLTQLLYSAKESFLNDNAIQAVVDHVHRNLKKQPLSSNNSASVNDSLLLLRNILHATERSSVDLDIETTDGSANCAQHNQLVWKLFAQGLDRLLIKLLSGAQKEQWAMSIVQLISLLYKERPVDNILAILHTANGSIISEQSSFDEDKLDKSRRSDSRHSSSSGFYSEDSNEPNLKQEMTYPSLKRSSEIVDVERLGLLEIGLKEAKRHSTKFQPNEQDISNLLKEFTVNFIVQGYNTLVGQVHQQLLHAHLMDKSHFFWLISYFLPVASEQLSVQHLKDVLSIEMLCYLTWEAVHLTEELDIYALIQPPVVFKPFVRRLHLCIKAIREYVNSLERFSRPHNGPIQLLGYLPSIKDLGQLFLLQLRQFNPIVQSPIYLLDVITANHALLQLLERSHFDLNQHLTQFCSKTILDRYGTALDAFETNSQSENDCIFTMLHHVAGDLGRADLLCQPAILGPFTRIWKSEFMMRDDWNDLIEYITQKCLRNFEKSVCFDMEANSLNGIALVAVEYSIPTANIESLLVQLKDSGFQKQLDWIQSSLLAACAARLGQELRNPLVSLSFQMNLSCPIVPWKETEASALRSDLFLFFLLRIGLIPPAPQVALYPRIPREWSPDTLYSVALLIGPVDQKRIDLTRVNKIDVNLYNSPVDVIGPACYAIRSNIPFCEGEEIPPSLDSISTTSSLEVHKTESSDDEMEDDESFL